MCIRDRKEAIEKVLNLKVIDLPIDPQLMGALGAAEFARQKGMAKEGDVYKRQVLHGRSKGRDASS